MVVIPALYYCSTRPGKRLDVTSPPPTPHKPLKNNSQERVKEHREDGAPSAK
jgi:hypothetical protein